MKDLFIIVYRLSIPVPQVLVLVKSCKADYRVENLVCDSRKSFNFFLPDFVAHSVSFVTTEEALHDFSV